MIAIDADIEQDHARLLSLRLILIEDSAADKRCKSTIQGTVKTYSSVPQLGQV